MGSISSPNRLFALLTIAFLLGIGCTSAVFWLFLPPGNDDQLSDIVSPRDPTESHPSTDAQASSSELSRASKQQELTAQSLDYIAAIKSTSEQQLALRIFLFDLDEARLSDLLTQSKDVFPVADKHAYHSAIVERLAHQDPSRALSLVLELDASFDIDGLVTCVFKEWVHSNLNEAVSRAQTLRWSYKRIALDVIVQERTDLSDGSIRAIARELDDEEHATSAIAERKIEEALGDPEKAWNELVVSSQDDISLRSSFVQVATVWVEESGLSVLDQVYQSLTNTETRHWVIRWVLEEFAHSDPASAFEYALTVYSDQDNDVVRAVAVVWASSGPQAALSATSVMEDVSAREKIAETVLRVWARTDPQAALSAANAIEDVLARERVAETVVRVWSRNEPAEMLENVYPLPSNLQEIASTEALTVLSSESPEEAAQFVATMKTSSLKTSTARSVVMNWSILDYSAALDWILNEPRIQEIRFELLSSIMHTLTEFDPDLAMSTARAQPIEQRGMFGSRLGMEYGVISSLASSDLDKAIELLPQARDGRTKHLSFQAVTQELVRNDEIDKAFGFAQRLAGNDRELFYAVFSGHWAMADPVAALNAIDRFPSRDARSRAAVMLVTTDQISRSLTDEQVDEATKHLTEEHAKALEEGDTDALNSIFLWE